MPLIDYRVLAKIYASISARKHVTEEPTSAKTLKAVKDLFSRDNKIVNKWCNEHTKEDLYHFSRDCSLDNI